jgi:hypothetical protein
LNAHDDSGLAVLGHVVPAGVAILNPYDRLARRKR